MAMAFTSVAGSVSIARWHSHCHGNLISLCPQALCNCFLATAACSNATCPNGLKYWTNISTTAEDIYIPSHCKDFSPSTFRRHLYCTNCRTSDVENKTGKFVCWLNYLKRNVVMNENRGIEMSIYTLRSKTIASTLDMNNSRKITTHQLVLQSFFFQEAEKIIMSGLHFFFCCGGWSCGVGEGVSLLAACSYMDVLDIKAKKHTWFHETLGKIIYQSNWAPQALEKPWGHQCSDSMTDWGPRSTSKR